MRSDAVALTDLFHVEGFGVADNIVGQFETAR
jgi:hypothetical protein